MLIQGRIAKSASLETAVTNSVIEKFFLFISLGLILFLVGLSLSQIFNSSAAKVILETPKNFSITNVTDVSFTVSWETEKPLTGYLIFGESKENLHSKVFDNMASGNMSSYTSTRHAITLTNLEADREYFFKIVSGEREFTSINGEEIKAVRTDSESFLKNPSLGKP